MLFLVLCIALLIFLLLEVMGHTTFLAAYASKNVILGATIAVGLAVAYMGYCHYNCVDSVYGSDEATEIIPGSSDVFTDDGFQPTQEFNA